MTIEKAFLKSHVLQDFKTDLKTDLFVTEGGTSTHTRAAAAGSCEPDEIYFPLINLINKHS